MRTIFDMLDKEKKGYLEIASLKSLMEQHGMDASLPDTLGSKYASGKLNFHQFAHEFGNRPDMPGTPELARRVRRTPGGSNLRPNTDRGEKSMLSPMLYSVGVQALQEEATQLKAKLLSAEAEITHLRSALKQAEDNVQRTMEVADDQMLQTETMQKALQEAAEVRWRTELTMLERTKDDQIQELRQELAVARKTAAEAVATPTKDADGHHATERTAMRRELQQVSAELELSTHKLQEAQLSIAQLERKAHLATTLQASLDALTRDKELADELNDTLSVEVDKLNKQLRSLQVLGKKKEKEIKTMTEEK